MRKFIRPARIIARRTNLRNLNFNHSPIDFSAFRRYKLESADVANAKVLELFSMQNVSNFSDIIFKYSSVFCFFLDAASNKKSIALQFTNRCGWKKRVGDVLDPSDVLLRKNNRPFDFLRDSTRVDFGAESLRNEPPCRRNAVIDDAGSLYLSLFICII